MHSKISHQLVEFFLLQVNTSHAHDIFFVFFPMEIRLLKNLFFYQVGQQLYVSGYGATVGRCVVSVPVVCCSVLVYLLVCK